MLRSLIDVFWLDQVWLPPNISWEDMTNGPEKMVQYTEIQHLWYTIPFTLVITGLRYLLETCTFTYLGRSLGVEEKKKRNVPHNPKLETLYRKSMKLTQICTLAKQLDMTERQVERWWRLRRSQDKPSTLVKFRESCWRTTYLFYNVITGMCIVWNKDWFWKWDQFFIGYPHQGITVDEWWFYTWNVSFYMSLIVTHFWDIRRKDFWQMFGHHIITISLLMISWITNFHRCGTVLLVYQDSAEVLLELTKSIKYAKFNNLAYVSFAIFFVWWFYARVYIYIYYLFTVIKLGCELIGLYPCGVFMVILLGLLLILQIWWSWLILVVLFNALSGKTERDVRSSSSEQSDSDDSECDESGKLNGKKNM